MNPSTRAKLNRQIQVLLDNCFIRHSLNPCVVLVLLALKKDGSWRRCVDGRTVNNITNFIPPPVPRSPSPSSAPTDQMRILGLSKLNVASWIPLFCIVIRMLFMILIWLPPVLPSSILTNTVVILHLGLLAGVEFFFGGGE
ncbi:hypothetical protein L3X38_042198 [Prunus dulcis]|uniref:Uncharacterized protein n=1 Tax=Prunus dulcis TaxID=3755 RepID=A0AAD4UVU3_PRUDU|nr:hypothetical protein L3X38_042198 [Prunus dulcis]